MKPRRWLLLAVAAMVLAATVLAYRDPAVTIQLGEQIWACFG